MRRLIIFLVLPVLLQAGSCGGPNREKPAQEAKKELTPLKVPDFSEDSAYAWVAKQVAFGPRVTGTPAHQKCAAFLTEKLRQYSKDVTVQKGEAKAYDGTILRFQNLIASFGPAGNNRILLAAHWDSRPYADYDKDPAKRNTPIDGANDGASGVGILLEVARQLSINPPPVGVDIIFFDAEDYGPPADKKGIGDSDKYWGLGSQYWSKQPHIKDYTARYGILLDMVGARNATFLTEGFSMSYAPDVVRHVWDIGNRIGYSGYFIYEDGGFITDDHIAVNKDRQIPMIDIIHLDRSTETGFYPYWHTTGDSMDKIDKTTLGVVGKTLMTVIFNP